MNFLNGYKTYIGILFTILGALATLFNWTFVTSLPDWQNSAITLVGALIAIFGRAVAQPAPAAIAPLKV